jgi:hypothetical protein
MRQERRFVDVGNVKLIGHKRAAAIWSEGLRRR